MSYPTFHDMGGSSVANHLTPSELADELQMQQQEVIGAAVAMGVPIFHGRIDRSLFEQSMRTLGPAPTAQSDAAPQH